MLSGNGRHRRPKQAPALLVTFGVTGAGLALPLLGSGSAQAVSDGTWDRAAECESGGVWSANTGNGYFGGFQLSRGMWEEYGGLEFADRPDLASRAQQIAVAERILADLGPDAFPGCALLTGLWAEYRAEHPEEVVPPTDADDGSAEDGETDGSDGSEDSDDSDGSEDSGAEDSTADEGTEDDAGNDAGNDADAGAGDAGGSDADGDASGAQDGSDEGDASAEDGSDAPQDAGSGSDPGSDADTGTGAEGSDEGADEGDADAAEDGVGRAPTGRHRGNPDPAESGLRPTDVDSYTIRSGDSLWSIAGDLGVPGGWPALYQENKSLIGDDPDLIFPGQELDLTVTGD